ncbi:MAG TPA: DUF222 domain-containing protein [Mycobacteriales bacterium]|nr:DUF222 domain-containing protein [Mycobacteriales bacterium]
MGRTVAAPLAASDIGTPVFDTSDPIVFASYPPDQVPADDDSLKSQWSPATTLDWVADGPAGPMAINLLSAIRPEMLDSFDRVRLLRAWQRQVAFCEAMVLQATQGIVDDAFDPRFVGDEVAAAARISRPAADRKILLCRRLTAVLTETAAALCRGDVSYLQALAIHEETQSLPPDLARQVEAKCLRSAGAKTVGKLRAALRKAVAAIDPDGYAERHAARRASIDVSVLDTGDGFSLLSAEMAAPDAATVKTAVDAWADAHRVQHPDLTVGQRRAAALVEWARQYLADPTCPTYQGRPANVDVVIDLPTLLGLADHPGEVIGYGVIPADVARAIAADGEWRRLVTDPQTGHLLDCGRRRYRPTQRLREFLLARERVSSFPGSAVPAPRCDLDHAVAWERGGRTDRDNLGPFDRRSHRAKTHGDWQVHRDTVGATIWRSPTGHRYRIEPHDYRLGP